MVKFVDKHFVMEMNIDEGAVVIDADLQGAWEFGDQEQMRYAFPRAYNAYNRLCMNGLARVGTALIVEDCGYKIVILFTKRHRNDSKELTLSNFRLAIDDMIRKIPSDVFVYSPILGRADHCFDEMLKVIYRIGEEINGSAGYNWFVYNKKGNFSA